jgi:hypothetical protein
MKHFLNDKNYTNTTMLITFEVVSSEFNPIGMRLSILVCFYVRREDALDRHME